MFGDGQLIRIQIVANANPITEIVDDDDDEDGEDDGDDDDDASDISSTMRGSRSQSFSSSLPTSRKPSPLPMKESDTSFFGRVGDAVGGIFGKRTRRGSVRGQYNAVGGQ